MRAPTLTLLATALLAAGGCRHISREQYFLRAHTECGGGAIVYFLPGLQRVYEVEGCGIRDAFFQVRNAHRVNAASDATRRASFETGCPEPAMRYAVLGEDQLGVDGCGARRVYVSTRTGWILNAEERAAAPPPPTVPPGYGSY